eukprot:gene15287-16535_t
MKNGRKGVICDIATEVHAIEATVDGFNSDTNMPALKDLGDLLSRTAVQQNALDNILTAELHSGQQQAIQQRKALTKKCAQLESRIEAWHANTGKSSAPTPPTPAAAAASLPTGGNRTSATPPLQSPPSYNDALRMPPMPPPQSGGAGGAGGGAAAAAAASINQAPVPQPHDDEGMEAVHGLCCSGTSPTTVTLEWEMPAAALSVDPNQRHL